MSITINYRFSLPEDISSLNLSKNLASPLSIATAETAPSPVPGAVEGVVRNPFFWTLCLAPAAAVGVFFAATVLPMTSTLLVAFTAITALSAAFCAQSERQRKWLHSEISLLNSSMLELIPPSVFNHPWYNEITPSITLGSAPLKTREHFQNLKQTHHAVLSLIEDFEHDAHLLGIPVRSEDWTKAGLSFLHLPTADMSPVKLEDLKRGVEWMHEQISQNKKVYVHCLAGLGRSATVVVCYLIKYCNYTPKEAAAFVKSKRITVVNEYTPAVAAFVSDLSRSRARNAV